MNKKNIIKIISITTFIAILTGCINQENNNKNELEIINFTIKTQAYNFSNKWQNFSDGCNPDSIPNITMNSTVYLPDEYSKARYLINGTVKNIADYKISNAIITIYFYNENNTLIKTKQLNNLSGLQPGEEWHFQYEYMYDNLFKQIKNIEIKPGPETIDVDIKEN